VQPGAVFSRRHENNEDHEAFIEKNFVFLVSLRVFVMNGRENALA